MYTSIAPFPALETIYINSNVMCGMCCSGWSKGFP